MKSIKKVAVRFMAHKKLVAVGILTLSFAILFCTYKPANAATTSGLMCKPITSEQSVGSTGVSPVENMSNPMTIAAETAEPAKVDKAAEKEVSETKKEETAVEEAPEEEDAFGGIMHTSTPIISEVKFSPEAPKAGEAVTVSAKVELGLSDDEDAKLKSVKVGYSVDAGKIWNFVDMTMTATNTYSAQIPAQDAGKEVSFYVSAEDSYHNLSTEAPFKSAWPSTKENLIQGATDMDNSEDIVPADLDIVNTMIGYDDEYLYVSYSVQGKITGGTIEPPYIHVYGAKITNPDTEEGEGLMVGKLFIYGPMAPTLAEKFKAQLEQAMGANFQIPECGVIDIQKVMANPVEAYLKAAEPSCEVKENTFTGKIKRAALGENPSGTLRVIFITAANASIESFMPIPLNATHYTQLYMKNHTYKVGG